MPTKRRRHSVTETPPVEEALDELRTELGGERVDLGELVVLGARAKLEGLRRSDRGKRERRSRLADRVRSGSLGIDVNAADEVRAHGWTRDAGAADR